MVDDYNLELRRLLRDAGCHLIRTGKGSHEVWLSPLSGRTFAVPDCRKRHTANGVLKQAGMPKAF